MTSAAQHTTSMISLARDNFTASHISRALRDSLLIVGLTTEADVVNLGRTALDDLFVLKLKNGKLNKQIMNLLKAVYC